MTPYDVLIAPFADFGFMRRALIACLALGLGSGPVGVLLLLRRMSLVGDAMSHAVLPGAAIGFLAAGLSLPAMGLGGLIAGLAVALLSGLVSRTTLLREDASFATFYLTSLAAGVLIVSLRGSNIDLLHVLFGTILAIDTHALYLIGGITSVTLIVLAIVYRPLVTECFDPGFLRAVAGRGPFYHSLILFLVVINLVAGFQALGTLMAVGLMMLPAAVARLWVHTLPALAALAAGVAALSGLAGLIVSFHFGFASGPTIVLTASVLYGASLLLGPAGAVRRLFPRRVWRAEHGEPFMTCRSVVVSVMLIACLFAGTHVADAKQLEAVASFTVLANMVHQVGGDRVHVQTLVGPNGDPHAFEPTPDDARKLKAADIVFVSGLGLEGWMDRLIAASGYQGKPVVASRGIQTLHMQEGDKQITDPHAWNSAANGVIYVRNIVAALSAADPAGAAAYQANGDRYAAVLKTLDDYARQQVATVPAGKRKVLTSHDAFGYFGHAYGVTFLSPLGYSTESEPSAQQVAALIKQIKAQHVARTSSRTPTTLGSSSRSRERRVHSLAARCMLRHCPSRTVRRQPTLPCSAPMSTSLSPRCGCRDTRVMNAERPVFTPVVSGFLPGVLERARQPEIGLAVWHRIARRNLRIFAYALPSDRHLP